MKVFEVCIASRYMYNDFREYNNYIVEKESIGKAINYAKEVISYWNKKDNTTTYELFDIWQKKL